MEWITESVFSDVIFLSFVDSSLRDLPKAEHIDKLGVI
jgi:hypothetical protein